MLVNAKLTFCVGLVHLFSISSGAIRWSIVVLMSVQAAGCAKWGPHFRFKLRILRGNHF